MLRLDNCRLEGPAVGRGVCDRVIDVVEVENRGLEHLEPDEAGADSFPRDDNMSLDILDEIQITFVTRVASAMLVPRAPNGNGTPNFLNAREAGERWLRNAEAKAKGFS
jgi:hypothetical protein